ncbi:MAG: HAMP domain-containing histidine kinase [Arcobacter sp.]|nr:HAMP domain-containing histidine kinase [Arcobacter sp.]
MENLIFDEFFDDTIEGIIIIENGFIININNAILDILNYSSKEDLIGNLATGILIPKINREYLEYNNKIFEEVSIITRDGKIIPSIIKVKDLIKNDKEYKVVYILNLEELKEKESLLLEQSKMAAMGKMISMISHQWKQPLSAVMAAISNVKLRIKTNKFDIQTFENKIDSIEKYIYYMSNTIDDFLSFFNTNKKKELISIDSIVKTALKMIENGFKNQNIEIIDIKSDLTKIYIYKNELLQVILNVLNNSKDAIKVNKISNPKVIIEYKEELDYQKLIITDNAGGINNNIINQIFDPYFSTKNEKNGTGIGLYMCKTIIEEHCNGTIKAININNGASIEIKIKK